MVLERMKLGAKGHGGSRSEGRGTGATGDGATGDGATGDGATADRATGDGATGDGATGVGPPGAAPSPVSGRDRLAAVIRASKFEVIPLPGILDAVASALPAGAVVTVTCSPTRGLEPTLAICEELAAARYAAVPHLAARSIRDDGHLADVLARLDAAAIDRVFVVGGDATGAGAFPDGLSLLRAMEAAGHRFAEVGVPAYPEGHPRIAGEVLWGALAAKQPHADSMTTQLSFDARAVATWLREARDRGVTLPVEIGVPGPADMARLLRVSTRIGVADAARYLRKNRGVIGAVLRRNAFRPDPLLRGLGAAVQDPGARIQGLHVYTFNQVDAAARWQRRALERLG
jgi:methylenetetrahydrofolate reductase (NADPH)